MNKDFSNILVAYDGSDDSVKALKKAENLKNLCDSRLTVVYVEDKKAGVRLPYDHQPISAGNSTYNNDLLMQSQTYVGPVPTPINSNSQNQEIIENTTDRVLSDAKSRLSHIKKDVDYEVLFGSPGNEICNYAKQHEVDLIVLGSRGISGIKKLVMGSVSDKVTNHSDCPVLVVK